MHNVTDREQIIRVPTKYSQMYLKKVCSHHHLSLTLSATDRKSLKERLTFAFYSQVM